MWRRNFSVSAEYQLIAQRSDIKNAVKQVSGR